MSRNKEDIYRLLGASNHSNTDREENDFYSTDPDCVKDLLQEETFSQCILEPCCGTGNISKVLEENDYKVTSTDLIDRGFGNAGVDFFSYKNVDMDIISNPPYGMATEFVDHFLKELLPGHKMALFLKIQFLEGNERWQKLFSKKHLKTVYVYSKRVACYKNDDRYQKDENGNILLDKEGNPKKVGSAVAFAWFVWDNSYSGWPTLKWVNTSSVTDN